MRRTRRWPKGTYMQLINPDRLRSFVGPEASKKMSGRRLARYIDTHPSFVDHLLSGRRKSCKTTTAERIAEALDVPLEILFVPVVPSNTGQTTKQSAA